MLPVHTLKGQYVASPAGSVTDITKEDIPYNIYPDDILFTGYTIMENYIEKMKVIDLNTMVGESYYLTNAEAGIPVTPYEFFHRAVIAEDRIYLKMATRESNRG